MSVRLSLDTHSNTHPQIKDVLVRNLKISDLSPLYTPYTLIFAFLDLSLFIGFHHLTIAFCIG